MDAAADALEAAADAATKQDEVSTKDAGDQLWRPTVIYDPLVDAFLDDAKRFGRAGKAARRSVAARYGLTVPMLDETISFLRAMERDGYNGGRKIALRSQALRLVSGADRPPILVALAAAAIDQLAEDGCGADEVAELMRGSRDRERDLWAVATGCSNSSVFAAAMDGAPSARPALSYLLMNWTSADSASALAAADMLLQPDFLARIAPAERDRVHADIVRFKLANLLDVGLLDEAIAFIDSLSPRIRALALRPEGAEITTSVGGFRLKTSAFRDMRTADYAAALALAGRKEEARAALDAVAPAAARKRVRACLDEVETRCASDRNVPIAALIVDQLLDRPDDDPYVLVESAAIDFAPTGAGVTEALCRLLSQPTERSDCIDAREAVAVKRAGTGSGDEEDRALWTQIRGAGGAPFEAARAAYAARLSRLPRPGRDEIDRPRNSVDPAPVPFRESPLPAEQLARGTRDDSDPRSFAPLPEGYQLVRVERSGGRAAAISLSQRFDPNGEVTGGGYWLHLSDDAGRTWQPPLYTGLAEHFPYIVPKNSRLPMIAGDRLLIEVEEALIDTASITYPPIGTRLKRERKGLYLEIPIAALHQDSDGDGLSDPAARHLLLDQPATSGTPFIVGRDEGCSPPPPETWARLELLKKLFAIEARALIEPAGRTKEGFGGWRRSGATDNPPIFLLGNPEDYRCLSIDRMMVVYSEADRERLRTFSPDFQLLTLPPIRWNRDKSRGFVRWGVGWAGGTYRVIRDGQSWKLVSISEWIS